MTGAEIALARRMFGERIDYARVTIVTGKCMMLHLPHQVMALDGHVDWPGACSDVTACGHPRCRDTFIDEMAHGMQHQQGVRMFWCGLWLHGVRVLTLGRFDPHRYVLRPGKPFSAYDIEQQAELAVEMLHGRYSRQFDV